MNHEENNSNRLIYMSFILTAVIVLSTYMFVGFFPFGENTIMRVDLYHQYGPFHEELRHRLLNGQSLFYSWEGGLGKEFISQLAYYTASPISLLMLLFPQGLLPEAMAVFALLKISFAAAFFSYYLKKTFSKNDMSIVIFSIMYAFMAFFTAYYWNIMWLDAIAMFPFVALGIESLVKDGKYKTYAISLALVIIFNFYIAFIVCVFAVLYYLVILFSNYSLKTDKKIIINRTIKFSIMSLIAGGISMILTIPTAIALSHTATSDSSFPKFKVYQNIYQMITNHFVGARPVVLARNEDLPNVYSGVFTMILLPAYFANRKIALKEKLLFAALIIFMLLCSNINILDYLIHGAHFPSNLPHRYTFIYSFILIMLAYKAFINIKDVNIKYVVIIGAVYIANMLITEYLVVPGNKEVERVLTDIDILVNAIIIVIYILIIKYMQKSRARDYSKLISILLILVLSESVYASFAGFSYVGTTNREKYVKYIDGTNEVLDYLEENDNDEFYRMDFRRFTTINDAALYHFRGFSQFSSLAYGDTSALIGDIGVAATGNSYRYYDPTPLVDAIFNMKYIMNKDNPLSKTRYEHIADFGGNELDSASDEENTEDNNLLKKKTTSANVSLYKNNQYLPLGFMTNKDILEWKTKDSTPFEVQNDFVRTAAGISDEMITPIEIKEFNYENIKITDDNGKNAYKYKLTNPDDLSAIPSVSSKIYNDKEQHVYIYVDAGNAKRVKYSFADVSEDRELSAGKSLFDLGQVPADTEISVNFTLDRKGEYEKTYRQSGNVKIYAGVFNQDVFDKVYNKLSEQPMDIYDFSSDTLLKAKLNAKEDGILFTSIPYDKGWNVTIDGEKAELIPIAGDGLIGINVTQGEHEIVFKYKAPGFVLGLIITLISLAAFALYIFIDNKKIQRTEQ